MVLGRHQVGGRVGGTHLLHNSHTEKASINREAPLPHNKTRLLLAAVVAARHQTTYYVFPNERTFCRVPGTDKLITQHRLVVKEKTTENPW